MRGDTRAGTLQYAKERGTPILAFLIALAVYHFTFAKFFPNANGNLGHDYSFAFPALLSGFYWFQSNGIWQVPWFTPAFCGGLPLFADPQSAYYSLLQVAALFMNPLTAAYSTTLLFAALGFWGMYLLLR